jgi:hypothetical protein
MELGSLQMFCGTLRVGLDFTQHALTRLDKLVRQDLPGQQSDGEEGVEQPVSRGHDEHPRSMAKLLPGVAAGNPDPFGNFHMAIAVSDERSSIPSVVFQRSFQILALRVFREAG